jgi:hypothetical protein
MELRSHPKMIWRGRIRQWPPHWGGSFATGDDFIDGDPPEAKIKELILINDKVPAALQLIVDYKRSEHSGLILCDDSEFLTRLCEKIKPLNLSVYQLGRINVDF